MFALFPRRSEFDGRRCHKLGRVDRAAWLLDPLVAALRQKVMAALRCNAGGSLEVKKTFCKLKGHRLMAMPRDAPLRHQEKTANPNVLVSKANVA